MVTTFAGNGAASWIDGPSGAASFRSPRSLTFGLGGVLYVADYGNNRIRAIINSIVSTFAGNGVPIDADGAGTSSSFAGPSGIVSDNLGNLYICTVAGYTLRKVTISGIATTIAGTAGSPGYVDGQGASARLFYPEGVAYSSAANSVLIADATVNRIRNVSVAGLVTTVAGDGTASFRDAIGTNAQFTTPRSLTIGRTGLIYVADQNHRIRVIDFAQVVTTIAGSGTSGMLAGYGIGAQFNSPWGITATPYDTLIVGELHGIRELTCVPCPASYYCVSGTPALCPAGFYCPLSSITPTLCPKGTFSNAGASNCTVCPAGTFASSTGSTSCQKCPGGHFCPSGTSSWARLNCGRGNYCPDGSGAPTPCPYQVPPSGGWGALQVQGPAFLVETAHCLNHCFWNFTSGDGMLSKC
jgi:hypothetical protein